MPSKAVSKSINRNKKKKYKNLNLNSFFKPNAKQRRTIRRRNRRRKG